MTRTRDDDGCRACLPGALLLAVLCGCATERPVVQEQDSPPAVAQVRDGIGPDVDQQKLRTSLFANWDDFVDPEGTAVLYEWSAGTAPGRSDVLDWRDVAGSRRAAATDLDLPLGVRVHVNVRARDLAGNRSAIASSDGIVIGGRAATAPPLGEDDTAPPPSADHLVGVDRHGITWTFSRPARCGRFVNGDWWVVGPIEIAAITPA
ncbi:MAG TPA: hypothetical protein ENI87_01505, partial [bacterium]|nr:hypothetical protein [bacterium]